MKNIPGPYAYDRYEILLPTLVGDQWFPLLCSLPLMPQSRGMKGYRLFGYNSRIIIKVVK
jgi:hypothetical protein